MATTVKMLNDGKQIQITLDISPATSASGKSLVVASTHGNMATTEQYKGKPIIIGVNAYVKA
jgi:hypothetical protein